MLREVLGSNKDSLEFDFSPQLHSLQVVWPQYRGVAVNAPAAVNRPALEFEALGQHEKKKWFRMMIRLHQRRGRADGAVRLNCRHL